MYHIAQSNGSTHPSGTAFPLLLYPSGERSWAKSKPIQDKMQKHGELIPTHHCTSTEKPQVLEIWQHNALFLGWYLPAKERSHRILQAADIY